MTPGGLLVWECLLNVARLTHDQETDTDSLRDADELPLVRLCRVLVRRAEVRY